MERGSRPSKTLKIKQTTVDLENFERQSSDFAVVPKENENIKNIIIGDQLLLLSPNSLSVTSIICYCYDLSSITCYPPKIVRSSLRSAKLRTVNFLTIIKN